MEFNHITYLETLSRESVVVKHTEDDKHFGIASGYTEVEELLSGSTSRKDLQIVAIDDTSGGYLNHGDSNLYDNREYSFMILKSCPDIQDMQQRRAAVETCKQILRTFLSRMHHDAYQASKIALSQDTIGLRNFSASTLKYFTVGPVADNFHGLSISFTLGAPDLTPYNPNEWQPQS